MKVEQLNAIQGMRNIEVQEREATTVAKQAERNLHKAEKEKTAASVDVKNLKKKVEKLNKVFELFNVERRFVIDDRTGKVVVKIIDKSTGEVIDQIPPEEALERYYRMEQFIGLIFSGKA